jgi:serine/threonine protein kinase
MAEDDRRERTELASVTLGSEPSGAYSRSDALAPTLPDASAIASRGPGADSFVASIIPPSIVPGSVIGGSYRLLEEIGRGAMGVVLLALDERLQRRVAIKLIRSDAIEPGFHARFMLEARAMAQVNHPNVLCIYAFGEHDGTPYFVTEFVEGVTLEAWREAQSGPPPLDTALRIIDEICKGVAAIHAAGTVHRDLKPSNILVDSDIRTRVADFGVSTRYAGGGATVGEMAGTPAYMAPEVALSEGQPTRPSPLSDIYSLGCVAFELLTGQRPFQARGVHAWILQHMTEPVPLPSSLRPDLPKSFDRVLLGALEKKPERRTQSVEELRRAFAEARTEALSPERIVVAEDDADFREVLQIMLGKAFPNADIECVDDGGAALAALMRCPASIALIDLSMTASRSRRPFASAKAPDTCRSSCSRGAAVLGSGKRCPIWERIASW